MHNYFITYEKQRSYYTYHNSKVAMKLTSREIEGILEYISKKSIVNIKEIGDHAMEIIFEGNVSVTIDDIRVFQYNGNQFDNYIKILQSKIIKFSEIKNIQEYAKSLPKGYKPKTNRHKKQRGKVIAAGLSLVLIVNLTVSLNKEIAKAKENDFNDLENAYEIPNTNGPSFQFEETYFEPEAEKENVELEFQDRTETGKLDETILYCGNEIKYYSERYGLSYEVSCAQITQERDTKEGWMYNNPCQITYDLFIGRKMHIPVYNENGFTGEYDDFTITKEMLDSKEGNIMVAMAYNRICIDKFNSLFTGTYSYNQGEFALNLACENYSLNIDDYKGDAKAIEARNLINKYFQEKNELRGKPEAKHGDPLYLEHVFSYLKLENGKKEIQYYLNDKQVTVDLTNINVYNNSITRG